jgi:hypothetical protein
LLAGSKEEKTEIET